MQQLQAELREHFETWQLAVSCQAQFTPLQESELMESEFIWQ